MSISLEIIRELATDVANEQHERLVVEGVRAEGDYVEILLSRDGCVIEPCRMLIGVFRDAGPDEVRSHIAGALRKHAAARTT